jgi:repressor of nif and glnA expression
VLDDGWTMSIATLFKKPEGTASDAEVRYHFALLEDIGLIEIRNQGYIRVTSAGQEIAPKTQISPMLC